MTRGIDEVFYRGIQRAYLKPGASPDFAPSVEELARFGILAMSLFRFEDMLAVYYESMDRELDLEGALAALTPCLLDIVQGSGRKWRMMWELFHYSPWRGEAQWRRKQLGKRGIMRVNRLKPELFSSYVFHHYQLQEERPGFGDQYGLICFDDGLMCFYMENPEERETDPLPGALDTHNAPLERWQELMGRHFVPWPDTNQPWKQMRCLFSYIPEPAGKSNL